MTDLRPPILSLSAPELETWLTEHDAPAYRRKQVWPWLARGVTTFDAMRDVPRSLRDAMARDFRATSLKPIAVRHYTKDHIAVSGGLKSGETVVSAGVQMLRVCAASGDVSSEAAVWVRRGSSDVPSARGAGSGDPAPTAALTRPRPNSSLTLAARMSGPRALTRRLPRGLPALANKLTDGGQNDSPFRQAKSRKAPLRLLGLVGAPLSVAGCPST